ALMGAVEPGRQLAIFGLVALDVRVQQEQRRASHRYLPHTGKQRPCSRVDRDDDRNAARQRGTNRQLAVIERDVVLVLPARDVEPLTEVALVVIQADGDERQAEVRRALDVIAGKDAEAARVDGQRLVHAELRGEVRDGPRPQYAGVTRAPRRLRRQIFLHAAVAVVDAAVQGKLRRAFFELVDRHLTQ